MTGKDVDRRKEDSNSRPSLQKGKELIHLTIVSRVNSSKQMLPGVCAEYGKTVNRPLLLGGTMQRVDYRLILTA